MRNAPLGALLKQTGSAERLPQGFSPLQTPPVQKMLSAPFPKGCVVYGALGKGWGSKST